MASKTIFCLALIASLGIICYGCEDDEYFVAYENRCVKYRHHGDPCVYDVDTILSLNLLGGLISVTLGIEGICEPTCRCVRNFCIAI
ncbi:hypothetical protein QE152_g5675 [Popillia japonica]|uniref:Uncharacterized protein n=1 Tax=Popillia japonica TaxID=7064 RepID=A0AAW1MI22_POPJA